MQELSKIELLQKVGEQIGKISKSKEAHIQDERVIQSFIKQLQDSEQKEPEVKELDD